MRRYRIIMFIAGTKQVDIVKFRRESDVRRFCRKMQRRLNACRVHYASV